jgi:hypothetical protein
MGTKESCADYGNDALGHLEKEAGIITLSLLYPFEHEPIVTSSERATAMIETLAAKVSRDATPRP